MEGDQGIGTPFEFGPMNISATFRRVGRGGGSFFNWISKRISFRDPNASKLRQSIWRLAHESSFFI